jgi:putative FmdB family regulatory protein
MPIYEYECGECRHRLEVIQKFSDAPLVDCPECGAPSLSKLISAAGFRLGGSGWYETDFKNGNKRNLKEGGDAAKPDAKPACDTGACNAGACKAAATAS